MGNTLLSSGQQSGEIDANSSHSSSIPSSIEQVLNPNNSPLTFSQQRLWFLDQLEGSLMYHLPIVFKFKGSVNKDAVTYSLNQIVNRHKVLRSVIVEENDESFQSFLAPDELIVNQVQLTGPGNDLAWADREIDSLINIPFDLTKDRKIRATLITSEVASAVLVVVFHQIAVDRVSLNLFKQEFYFLYNAFVNGKSLPLAPFDFQYTHYAEWQRSEKQVNEFNKGLLYWKDKLKDISTLQLPTDQPRPQVQSSTGAVIHRALPEDLFNGLTTFSKANDVTVYTTLLAAFKILLYRYSGQQDICIGTTTNGRYLPATMELIGYFENILPLRTIVQGDASFASFLQTTSNDLAHDLEHQQVPFENIVDAVVKERDMNRNPLFDVMFTEVAAPLPPPELAGGLYAISDTYFHNLCRFDITFTIEVSAKGVQLNVLYATDLFEEATIKSMLGNYETLIESILKDSNVSVATLPMLSAAEERRLLLDFNNTQQAFDSDSNISKLFDNQVIAQPSATAVVFEHESITYAELSQRSNQLANFFVSQGVTQGMMVPVCIQRGIDMIAVLLGVLKTGAAFIPVDPEYPLDRIRYMLEDSGAPLVITNQQNSSKLSGIKGPRILLIDTDQSSIDSQPVIFGENLTTPESLAYVIYTSGSTGKPKGVMVHHRAVVNLLQSTIRDVAFNSGSGFLAVTTFSFDICYLEFFVPLVAGGRLIIAPREVAIDGFRLSAAIASHRPTHMQGTPSTWQLLLDSGWQNSEAITILIGGEAVTETIKNSLTKIAVVYNMYGPTETTIWSAIKKLSNNEKVVIGKPIANTVILILSDHHQLCIPKTPGEICIGGVGLAKGYLHQPELTAEKFIDSPFSKDQKIYKTGDLGRWLPDGNIEYLGRMDNQVKVKGYRIELGEIETCFQQSELVHQAVVIAKENAEGVKRLVGYYIPEWQALKNKEKELYLKQVSSWQEVYDTEYAEVAVTATDEEFDYDIWKDSFTGVTFEEKAMREWLQHTVDVILQDNPQYVLEIGSGKGLIFYRLTGKINKYIGTDFSASCIRQIQQRIDKGLRDYGPTDLYVCAAHEVSLDESEEVDTIVINSVAQHFPGEDYMNDVIRKGIDLLKGKGRIVIGDVRNSRLLEAFKLRLDVHKMPASINVSELLWLSAQEVLKEEELLFSPEYFYNFQSLHPSISHIDIQLKRGNYINELSKYRFDAIIYVGIEKPVFQPAWQQWQSSASTRQMFNLLQHGEPVIAFKSLPNHRLYQEKLLADAISEKAINTVGELQKIIAREDKNAAAITEMLEAARAAGYEVRMYPDKDIYKMNVLLRLHPADEFVQQLYTESGPFNRATFTNIPLFTDIVQLMQKDIRHLLQQSLPDYMIPSEFNAIARLPLTNNGKVDRKFLIQREDKVVVNTSDYMAPTTNTEHVLVEIWQELLGVERVGIHDNFFELGGHSLLATRTVSAVRKRLGQELFIKDLFIHPTIAALSANILTEDKGAGLPPITAQVRNGFIPLSYSQERLWFIDKMEGSLQYHLPNVLKLKGKINLNALSNAFRELANRHEVLRTVFLENDGVPYQHVLPLNSLEVSFIDGKEYENDRKGLQLRISQLTNKPFNLSEDHVIRVTLIQLKADEALLVVTMHHIATDGWSDPIILNELLELYKAGVENRMPVLPPVTIQYADFSIWQRQQLPVGFLESKIAYWKTRLNGVESIRLPLDYPRPAKQSRNGDNINFRIKKDLSDQLQALSQQQGVTLFMTLLSAFNVLLCRYSGQQDICVGTPIAGRQLHELEELVGFFVNTLALRNYVNVEGTFRDLLQEVKVTTLQAYEHQEAPFEKVVEVIVKERDISRNPLFQVMLVLLNTPEVQKLSLDELQLLPGMPESNLQHTSIFEITLFITETPRGLKCRVEYCTDLYSKATISRMMKHFIRLLEAIVEFPQQTISLLPMLSDEEINQVVHVFNNTASIYPAYQSIATLFEEQVLISPAATAIVFENEKISYERLNAQATHLAQYLVSKGLVPGSLVPICMERNIEMMVAIIAVVKAGAAYVPIDPVYPADRIKYIIADSAATIILVSKQTKNLFFTGELYEILVVDEIPVPGKNIIPLPTGLPDDLAYVIYTSGTTGNPKGVMVTNKNVISLVRGVTYTSFTSGDTLLSTGSSSFDATTFEYWGPLLNGGKLIICTDQKLLESNSLKELILTNKVNKMWFTSSWFNQLVDNDIELFQPINTLLVGGEKLSENHIEKLRQTYPQIEIINGYGPTENTTFSLSYPIQESNFSKPIPIGKPISNRSAYIVDGSQQLVPIGVFGEILLGGAGLSKGYLNQPLLTAQKFVKAKLAGAGIEVNVYKSGDIGRWLPDGNIEYAGRLDEQVKVRGYRIEPAEVENVLLQSELVKNAVVVAGKDSVGNNRLIGYVLPSEKFNKEEIISFLRTKLPEYMIPSAWVSLEKLPLTPNGKIDKNALPNPEAGSLLENRYEPPGNDLEESIVGIWQELLSIPRVGINDNFFELGGHSLSAIRLVAMIRRKLTVELTVNDIFIYPTISGLVKNIIERKGNSLKGGSPVRFLVPIKKGTNNVPLYIIAGGGGTALNFKKFGELLAENQPVFVLQPPIDQKELIDFPDNIEDIAGKFITEILIQNPDGPYALSGHCLGGIIAFEMARQLKASGKTIKLLALFDTIIGEEDMSHLSILKNISGLSSSVKNTLSKFVLKLNFQFYLLSKYTRYSVGNKLSRLKAPPKIEEEEFDDTVDIQIFKQLEHIFLKAYNNYHLKRYEGNLLLFYAKDHYYFYDKSHDIKYRKLILDEQIKNRWKPFAETVTMYDVDGEHSTIFHPSNGKEFARRLQQHLSENEI